jgi:hypothetical protein
MKKKKVVVNVPIIMTMKKSIEPNTKQNRIEDGHEDEHECEYEDEDEQCRWSVFYDAPNGTR